MSRKKKFRLGDYYAPPPSPAPGHDVKAVAEENGNTSNYYNGAAKDGSYQADGKGHSHVVSDSSGNVSHERDHGRK